MFANDWHQIVEAERRKWFLEYLSNAKPVLIEDHLFEPAKTAFVENNTISLAGLPEPLIRSSEAYYGGEKHQAASGHSHKLLETLFLLQHIAFDDEILKSTGRRYVANRTYMYQRNRRVFRKLENCVDNWYAAEMVKWAKSLAPIMVETCKRTKVKYSPGRIGSLRFTIIDGGFYGSHTLYEVDNSIYEQLDVFGVTVPSDFTNISNKINKKRDLSISIKSWLGINM